MFSSKLIAVRSVFTTLLICSLVPAFASQTVTIDSFSKTELFFLKSGCSFIFPAVLVYDSKKESWLTQEQARALIPNNNRHLTKTTKRTDSGFNSCSLTNSLSELEKFLGVKVGNTNTHIVLFFPAPIVGDGKKHFFEFLNLPEGIAKEKEMKVAIDSWSLNNVVTVHTSSGANLQVK
jgi:hypothetical protein